MMLHWYDSNLKIETFLMNKIHLGKVNHLAKHAIQDYSRCSSNLLCANPGDIYTLRIAWANERCIGGG